MWNEAEKFLTKDKYIGPLVKKYGHCKIKPRAKKYYFEDLVDSIVQQQLSMKAAASIFNRVKEKAEEVKAKKGKHRWRKEKTLMSILTPEKILSMSDRKLRNCGLSGPKVTYIKVLAKKVIEREVEIHKMDKITDEKIMEELILVKGIGRWTAEMFLMFTLARPDIFPVDDLGLKNAFKKLIKKEMQNKEIEIFAQRWKPYRTAASWYIWKNIDG